MKNTRIQKKVTVAAELGTGELLVTACHGEIVNLTVIMMRLI